MRNFLESKKWLALVCLAAALSLTTTACGSDDGDTKDNNPVVDAGDQDATGGDDTTDDDTTGDEDAGDEDAGDQDAGGDEDADAGGITCDTEGFTSVIESGQVAKPSEDEDGLLRITAQDGDTAPFDVLRLELWGEAGGATEAGTYEIDGPNYATCANCLFLNEDINAEGVATTTYMAQSGTLEITTFGDVDEQFTATLTGVEMVEVEVAEDDIATTPVADGAGYCIDSLSFDITLEGFGPVTPDPPVFPDDVTCDATGFAPDAFEGSLSDGDIIIAKSSTEADATSGKRDVLNVELYGASSIVESPTPYVVGNTYQIDDVNYATCTHCVAIFTECDDAEEPTCASRYNAGAGELTINALNEETGEFKATLTNAELVEVNQVGEYGLDTVIVEDGGGWCIDEVIVEGTLEVPEVIEPPACDTNDFSVAMTTNEFVAYYGGFFLTAYTGTDNTVERDQLEFTLYEDAYVTDESYAVDTGALCDNCVSIQTDCTGDLGACTGTKYIATEGDILVDEHDETNGVFNVTLTDAIFAEVDSNDELVADGAGWCISSVAVESTYEVPAP